MRTLANTNILHPLLPFLIKVSEPLCLDTCLRYSSFFGGGSYIHVCMYNLQTAQILTYTCTGILMQVVYDTGEYLEL